MKRLPAAPGQILDRSRSVAFRFAGRPVTGWAGDTIASALAAEGRLTFSRSFKYHRPRGLLCVAGKCPNCLVNVDGVPNVRACTEPAGDGMDVRPQNCWPSVDRDVLSTIQAFGFLLPVGFYYKLFARPRGAWRLAEPLIRRLAGLGRIAEDAPPIHAQHLHLHCDVAVVGGGPAGISAALAAATAGAEVFLFDDEPEPGGHLRYYRRVLRFDQPAGMGFELAQLRAEIAAEPRIRVFSRALAFGAYEGGLLAVRQGASLIHVRARSLVVATGAVDLPGSFEGNDLPGVLLAGGVRRLLTLYGIRPGDRAVVCGSDDDALALTLDLADSGVEVAAVLDRRSSPEGPWADAVRSARIEILAGHRIVAALGKGRVSAAVAARFAADGSAQPGSRREISCDLVVLATERAPSLELLRQRAVPCRFDQTLGQLAPAGVQPGIWHAGRLGGLYDLDLDLLQGEIAGLQAAAFPGGGSDRLEGLAARALAQAERLRAGLAPRGATLLPDAAGQFVCFCEDVAQPDVTRAIREGFDELETLKRYSTVSMGPCQGRMCLATAAALCAQRMGRSLAHGESTTARPPVAPVALGLLAGPHHEPEKRTPLHECHRIADAAWMDMGAWKRPRDYGVPEEEWRAVRDRVGIIDVGTLGKLELRGRDAGALLDRVYTHLFSGLPVGRSRYGLICNDEGVILDDGTVSRLDRNRYFLTTTTGNVDFVEQWLQWWMAGTSLCAHVTNVTGDYSAVNLAGPRARDTLRKVVDDDLSPESFKYMACREARVANIPALLLRIGFVGETGWEIHCPAGYGEHLWRVLLDAGAEFGIRPFGVEAQRILRLEKKHVIVGQDTDGLSTPFEADLAWCIRDEKADFIGKAGLSFQRGRSGASRLIGFVSDAAIPEGSAVVMHGKPAGRVTSCRRSPYRRESVGMALVPSELAGEGTALEIRHGANVVRGTVVHAPFYDPEGARLRR